ncbi:hypothetical protein TSAR_013170 [Trichomalopsis sarcophagae]|uniref:Uncharacterized protein n=1 Tax=Trichomalopsis sarcophagae TaxID=543379 RepID=A0A232EP57_9HYME|nr:hypothetical protein TSAR_013170 [Trichomalopsis sarcophagae]
MDYDNVIELQGFRDKEDKFLPKEVALVSLQRHVISHCVILPSHEFTELPCSLKIHNDYVAARYYGIHLFEGDITLRK